MDVFRPCPADRWQLGQWYELDPVESGDPAAEHKGIPAATEPVFVGSTHSAQVAVQPKYGANVKSPRLTIAAHRPIPVWATGPRASNSR